MNRVAVTESSLAGVIVVDKPVGLSSMDVVRHVRRAGGGVKTGHAGTLDPLATGVVICCVGKATRCVEGLMGMTKVYETVVDLSAFTATDDREGEREEIAVEEVPGEAAVRDVLSGMVGTVEQRPPAYSAIHVKGKRAYKLARKGEKVELAKRVVRIDAIEVLSYRWPEVGLRVTCGKGTYIRSIARELGEALGTGGHLAGLRRLSVGRFDLGMAVGIDRFERSITQTDLIGIDDL